jgi:hypothetical protein
MLAPLLKRADDHGRTLVVATGETATSISVVEAGTVLMERFLDWGLCQVGADVAAELELSPPQATELLLAAGNTEPGEASPSMPLPAVLQDILASAFHRVLQESVGCLGYCSSFLQSRPTESVVVTGSIALPGLRAALRKGLGVEPTGLADLIGYVADIDRSRLERHGVAVAGALIGGEAYP